MSENKEKSKNNITKEEKTSHIKEKKTSATTSGRAILRSTDSEALDAATVKTKTEKAEKVEEIVMSEREKPQKLKLN